MNERLQLKCGCVMGTGDVDNAEVVLAANEASTNQSITPFEQHLNPTLAFAMQAKPLLTAKKNILICLDAFGTLFTPRVPIPVAYAQAATQHGIDCGDTQTGSDVKSRFKDAFNDESKRNPNYGKASGLGAEQWWGNVSASFVPQWASIASNDSCFYSSTRYWKRLYGHSPCDR